MRHTRLLFALGWLVLCASPAGAVDYDEIDRTIGKEPAYASQKPSYGRLLETLRGKESARTKPMYALLLFGPEARLRVWAVLDGETLYLDRDGDGDLTGPGERFEKYADCKDIELADPDGQTRYVITGVGVYRDRESSAPQLMVNVDVKGPIEYQQYCDAAMKETPREAPIAHFHGPLTIGPRTLAWKVPPKLSLVRGEKPTELYALIGTMSADHGCWVVVRTHRGEESAFPEGVVSKVEVEFPSKSPDAPPVKRRYALDKFC
jgi:hypothetical protein